MTNPSDAEPFVGGEDGSHSANGVSLGASHHRKVGPAMEPAK
jgi:hypothetical protein